MKLVLTPVLAILIAFATLVPTAAAQTKMEPRQFDVQKAETPKAAARKGEARIFEGPASVVAPKGTVKGRMVSPGLSATCTSTDGNSKCECKYACWASDTGCGCPESKAVDAGIRSGAIKLRK